MKWTAIYAMLGLLTFGYAASDPNSCSYAHIIQRGECRSFVGLVSGIMWPLYWSREAFEAGRAALQEDKG